MHQPPAPSLDRHGSFYRPLGLAHAVREASVLAQCPPTDLPPPRRSLSIPFPNADNATLVKRVIEVDRVLRPSELSRELSVEGSDLKACVSPSLPPPQACLSCFLPFCSTLRAATVAQARVALDHLFSDIQLVVQTMHKFGPPEVVGQKVEKAAPDATSLEVGMMGSWEGVKQ